MIFRRLSAKYFTESSACRVISVATKALRGGVVMICAPSGDDLCYKNYLLINKYKYVKTLFIFKFRI